MIVPRPLLFAVRFFPDHLSLWQKLWFSVLSLLYFSCFPLNPMLPRLPDQLHYVKLLFFFFPYVFASLWEFYSPATFSWALMWQRKFWHQSVGIETNGVLCKENRNTFIYAIQVVPYIDGKYQPKSLSNSRMSIFQTLLIKSHELSCSRVCSKKIRV